MREPSLPRLPPSRSRRTWALSLLALAAALGGLAACEPRVPEDTFACTVDEDCPPDLVCRTNVLRCFTTLTDADAGE